MSRVHWLQTWYNSSRCSGDQNMICEVTKIMFVDNEVTAMPQTVDEKKQGFIIQFGGGISTALVIISMWGSVSEQCTRFIELICWWSSHQWMAQMSSSLCLYLKWTFLALALLFGLPLSSRCTAVGISYKHYCHLHWRSCLLHKLTEFVIKSYSQRFCVICILCFIYCTNVRQISSCKVCRLNVVKFQVKPSNFDGMSKSSTVILDFWISQGIVATQLGAVEDPVIVTWRVSSGIWE